MNVKLSSTSFFYKAIVVMIIAILALTAAPITPALAAPFYGTVATVTLAAQSGTLTYGTASAVTFAIGMTETGVGTATTTLTAVGLPAETSVSWNRTFPYAFNSPGTATLTVTSTTALAVGTYPFHVNSSDGNIDSLDVNLVVSKKALTITGLAAEEKEYDGNAIATLDDTNETLTGVVGAEDVFLSNASVVATFANKNVGVNKPVTVSGYTITGDDIGNYTLTQPTGLLATITKKDLTISGVVPNNKVYNGNPNGNGFTGGTLVGVVAPDAITLNTSGASFTFDNSNVGNGIDVNVAGFALVGTAADKANYLLEQPVDLTANITPKTLTVSGVTAEDKEYDRTTTATFDGTEVLNGVIGLDDVDISSVSATGTFASKNVGTGIAVTASGFTLTGAAAGNYSLTQPTGLSAEITAKELTVSGVTANNKEYDDTTNGNGFTGGTLTGIINPDLVTLDSSGATAVFASSAIGTGIGVTASGFSLSGADAGNYALADQPSGLTANITKKTLTISGLTIETKEYDRNTTATLDETNAALDGVVSLEDVDIDSTSASSTFASSNVGTGIAVTVSGFILTGTDASNYTLTQPSGLTGEITAKELLTGQVNANNKVYDGTTDTNGFTGGALSGIIAPDVVTLDKSNASGTFVSKDVAADISITTAGFGLTGTNAGNYILTEQPTGITADISAKQLTITGLTANNKVFDNNASATLSGTATLSGVISPDEVTLGGTPTAIFANATIENAKSVTVTGYTLSGVSTGNYTVAQPAGLTANITAPNSAPTDLSLTNNKINENQAVNTLIGTLSTTDPDLGDTFIYTFCGGVNDSSFTVSGNSLRSAVIFDYETKNSYSICIRATDSGTLSTTQTLTITINNLVDTQTFEDVATTYWAYNYIERLYNFGVTGGCSSAPLNYCPDTTVNRAQMAVFLLKSMHGKSFSPPAVGGSTGFGDVATDYWAAAWIKQLAAEGITGGCGSGNYCPDTTVTRAQMAVFLLKAKNGSSFKPPAVGASTGFDDVAIDYWAAAFIKQLVADGITSGCGAGIYCPDAEVTRGQMAVFLVKTFNMP